MKKSVFDEQGEQFHRIALPLEATYRGKKFNEMIAVLELEEKSELEERKTRRSLNLMKMKKRLTIPTKFRLNIR